MSHWLMQSEPVTLWQVVQGFFAQDFDLLLAYLHAPNGDAIAIWIVFLAGFSESMGQSVILFDNDDVLSVLNYSQNDSLRHDVGTKHHCMTSQVLDHFSNPFG